MTTQRLEIIPFAEEHLTDRYISWLNDPEVVMYSDQRFKNHTQKSCREYWQSFQNSPNFFWALVSNDPELGYIGTMTAYVKEQNKEADVGILIGEKAAWGRGYGLEAWQAVCDWLFESANIAKITAGTDVKNTAMRRIMAKAGMALVKEQDGKIFCELRRV